MKHTYTVTVEWEVPKYMTNWRLQKGHKKDIEWMIKRNIKDYYYNCLEFICKVKEIRKEKG